nr:hypothetical protein [Tanacetum cinerariifolium]
MPLGGEMDGPMENLGFDKEEELNEFMDDDQGEEVDEWLMALVTTPRATVTVPNTYEVGGPSTATPMGHPLTTMASGVATQPQVIDDLCVRMSNLEYRHEELVKKIKIVSDAETSLHGAWFQNQQLQTRLSVMENREGTLISYMSWMEERHVVLEKRLAGQPTGPYTTTHSDISLSDYEAFSFYGDHIEEISSGSTTTQSDISLPEYDSFIFDLSNDQFPLTDRSDFTHKEFGDESANIISPPEYDCFYFGNLPDPGITINRSYSFKPGLSHRCGTFKKFNTRRSHLNESPMEMLFSTLFLMDQ